MVVIPIVSVSELGRDKWYELYANETPESAARKFQLKHGRKPTWALGFGAMIYVPLSDEPAPVECQPL